MCSSFSGSKVLLPTLGKLYKSYTARNVKSRSPRNIRRISKTPSAKSLENMSFTWNYMSGAVLQMQVLPSRVYVCLLVLSCRAWKKEASVQKNQDVLADQGLVRARITILIRSKRNGLIAMNFLSVYDGISTCMLWQPRSVSQRGRVVCGG